jgi:hypothetical protein
MTAYHWLSVPSPWPAALLALAALRWTRLIGWDEWPPAAKLRARVIGERWTTADVPAGAEKAEGTGRVDAAELGLPGKQPSSEVSDVRPAYDRPTLAHLIHCPFCLGWWVSLAWYAAWLLAPRPTLYAAVPFAISMAVGILARNLDP